MNNHEFYMQHAIEMAKHAEAINEVPIGAIIVDADSGEIIAKGYNQPIASHDPTAHAEIIALRAAAQILENYRLKPNLSLYVTLEPCTMCAGAISFSRITKIIFGAYDIKGGAVENGARFFNTPSCHHRPEIIGGIMENECSNLLKDFFSKRRSQKITDKNRDKNPD